MFARREPDLLRKRLAEVDRDERLGKLSTQASTREKVSDTGDQLFLLFKTWSVILHRTGTIPFLKTNKFGF
jgi:hypothetical protein